MQLLRSSLGVETLNFSHALLEPLRYEKEHRVDSRLLYMILLKRRRCIGPHLLNGAFFLSVLAVGYHSRVDMHEDEASRLEGKWEN